MDSRSISLANNPSGRDGRLLNSLVGIDIKRVGLRYIHLSSTAKCKTEVL